MTELEDSSREITNALGGRAKILAGVSLWSKIGAATGALGITFAKIIGGSFGLLGAPKTFTDPFSVLIQNVSATVVFIAAVLIIVADDNSSKLLAKARIALDFALKQRRESEQQGEKFAEIQKLYDDELERLSHLQAARDVIGDIIENVAVSPDIPDEISVINRMLQTAKPSLFFAHGFQMRDMHTICVFQRVTDDVTGKPVLRCVSHIREIECNIAEARPWPEGIGVAGCALAQGDEKVVPDLSDPALGTLLNIPVKKPEDDKRYGSIVAEPVWSGNGNGDGEPWGIVSATTKNPGHFSVDDRRYVDVTKTLAEMVSLAVKLVRAKKAAMVVDKRN